MKWLVLCLGVLACSGGTSTSRSKAVSAETKSDPPPVIDAAPGLASEPNAATEAAATEVIADCAAAAKNMVAVVTKEEGKPSTSLTAAVMTELVTDCEREPWARAVRNCFAAAKTQVEIGRCSSPSDE